MRFQAISGFVSAAAFLVLPLVFPGISAAAAPVVQPGSCLYLVGAPPGAPAAAAEERDGDAGVMTECGISDAGAAINRDGENWIQAWAPSPSFVQLNKSCVAFAWISHDFEVGPGFGAPIKGIVRVMGRYFGKLEHLTRARNRTTPWEWSCESS